MSFAIISDHCHYDVNGTKMLRNDLLSKEERKNDLPFYSEHHFTKPILTFTITDKLAHLLVRKIE
jgi:hypothetical protein